MAMSLARRSVLKGAASLTGLCALGLAGCATRAPANGLPVYDRVPPLKPIRADIDRLFDITVCLRPFRAAGPRLDVEHIGDATVVHNYGHGGSGWSLSWGSGTLAVRKAMANSPKDIAVVGCGALGLTSAILAQDAGANVTIYARDLLAQTRSARATGSWTPDSRIALADAVSPDFPALWEEMARISFKTYRRYLGLPGRPVEWNDRYYLYDAPPHRPPAPANALEFASYSDRIADLVPAVVDMPQGSTPFPTPIVRRTSLMMFNIADYGHTLMSDFLARGGKIVRREFHAPGELAQLKEKVIINCPGYAARDWWKDETVVPVRGQIGWLVPQPEVDYGLYYNGVLALSRTDGIVIQMLDGGDMRGYNDADETPNRAESVEGVKRIAQLYSRFTIPAA